MPRGSPTVPPRTPPLPRQARAKAAPGAGPSDDIARLRAEHHNFQRLMKLFQAELAQFQAGEDADYGLMRDIMQYMVQFSDRFHHPREDLIFERLLQAEPAAAHAVRSILHEHEDMAARATELVAALQQIAADAMYSRESLEAMARDYLAELGTHIRKEEAVLFPLAQRHLRAQDWAAIRAQSRAYQDPLFGGNVAPGYRALFRRLAGAAPDLPTRRN